MFSSRRCQLACQSMVASVCLMTVGGCGGSRSTRSSDRFPTSQTTSISSITRASKGSRAASSPSTGEARATTLGIRLSSPVGLRPIQASFTCDGVDVSPPLSWTGTPKAAAEIQIYLFGIDAEKPAWAVAGIGPRVNSLPSGLLPTGAAAGAGEGGHVGYKVCPTTGSKEDYVIRIFAMPRRSGLHRGFDSQRAAKTAFSTALTSGLLTFSYKRR
jgi:phosphatidylethanolamine-binding protein (PEBP) family uncharacterized protein